MSGQVLAYPQHVQAFHALSKTQHVPKTTDGSQSPSFDRGQSPMTSRPGLINTPRGIFAAAAPHQCSSQEQFGSRSLSNQSRTAWPKSNSNITKAAAKKTTTPPPELRFQPRYASTHSVFAQKRSMKSEKKLVSSRLEMQQKLAPQRRVIIKDFNRIVDRHLREVVEKINVKQVLEKEQRQLQTKA